jgi:hypothetical protein
MRAEAPEALQELHEKKVSQTHPNYDFSFFISPEEDSLHCRGCYIFASCILYNLRYPAHRAFLFAHRESTWRNRAGQLVHIDLSGDSDDEPIQFCHVCGDQLEFAAANSSELKSLCKMGKKLRRER